MKKRFLKNVKVWYALLFFILYMLLCFSIPTLINGEWNQGEKTEEKKEEGEKISGVDIHSVNTIKLLLTQSQQVVTLDLEEYLKGVLIGEVPVTYAIEALKAQAVVARTYTLYQLQNAPQKHALGADMCDDIQCCQAYRTKEYALASWADAEENEKWAKLEMAVNSTKGQVITYQGELINAFFHAHSGGMTENVKYLWSKTEIPYLVSVTGNEGTVHQDTKVFSKAELIALLQANGYEINGEMQWQIQDYTGSGRVHYLMLNGNLVEATQLRNWTGIKSTNFRMEESGDNIIFHTVGYGHGVGMSQEGANQMALEGHSYQEIIQHYYTGVEIVQWKKGE